MYMQRGFNWHLNILGNVSEGYSPEGVEMKRTASEIMAATVRQTEERVSELRRRAEDSVNQVFKVLHMKDETRI